MQAARGASLTGGAAEVDGAPLEAPPRARRTLLLACVAAGIVLADIVSKYLIVANFPRGGKSVELLGGLFYLVHTRNTGAAFSMASGFTILLTCFAIVVVVVIARMSLRVASVGWAWALGLVLGGAAGNLIDRIFREPGPFRGGVVDFIALWDPFQPAFPVFNVADSALCIGVGLAVLLELRGRRMDGRHRNEVQR